MDNIEFRNILNNDIRKVEHSLLSFLPDAKEGQEEVVQAMEYSLSNGGKRLRPVFALEFARACGADRYAALDAACAVEYIHTYSLIHDDLPCMDNDDYRRGRLTTHKVFGENFGILAGDGLLNHAYEIMAKALIEGEGEIDKKAKAMEIIARKAGIYGMVGGQAVDVELTGKPLTEEQLDFIFRLKTGALIEAAFLAGGYLAGCDDETASKLEKAAALIGFAFQIRDDILDVTGSLEELGKPVFSDEKNNKTTYVTLYGLEKSEMDVESMSNEAVNIIKSIGNNDFLEELVCNLIKRNK